MAMNNEPRPSAPSFDNQVKISVGETWGSILTTWAAETRDWLQVGSLMNNSAKPVSSMNNLPRP